MKNTLLLTFLISIGGCATVGIAPPIPKPQESEHFRTEGGGFNMNESIVTCHITYTIKTQFQNNLKAKIEFENPVRGQEPLYTETNINIGDKELTVTSPPYPGIKNNKNYAVVLRVYDEEELVAEHKNDVQFALPEQILLQLMERGVKFY
ncbi:MAG: hypothetical protein ACR2P9_04620 [Gammaproteobacteria bacterium]